MGFIFWLFVALTGGFPQVSTAPFSSDTRVAILNMDDEWNAALLKHDTAYFSRILKDDFLFVDESGRQFGKLNFVGDAAGKHYSFLESKDRRVDPYDDFAILVGARTERFKEPFPDSEERFRRIRYVKVFKKENTIWQIVSYQESPIGPF